MMMSNRQIPLFILRWIIAIGALATCSGPAVSWAQSDTKTPQTRPQWLIRGLSWPNLTPQLIAPKHSEASGPSPQQISRKLEDMLKGMATSSLHLKHYHTGKNTQFIQHKIISDLDELIAMAKQMSKKSSSGKSSGKPSGKSGKMTVNSRPGSGQGPPNSSNQLSQGAMQSYTPTGSSINPVTGKPLLSNKHSWGNLPPRARNLILNGIRKSTLPGYRALVDSYYEALGKLNPNGH